MRYIAVMEKENILSEFSEDELFAIDHYIDLRCKCPTLRAENPAILIWSNRQVKCGHHVRTRRLRLQVQEILRALS